MPLCRYKKQADRLKNDGGFDELVFRGMQVAVFMTCDGGICLAGTGLAKRVINGLGLNQTALMLNPASMSEIAFS